MPIDFTMPDEVVAIRDRVRTFMQTEVQHTYDMWMVQASDSLSFSDKASHIVIGNLCMQNLDSSLHLEIYTLCASCFRRQDQLT